MLLKLSWYKFKSKSYNFKKRAITFHGNHNENSFKINKEGND